MWIKIRDPKYFIPQFIVCWLCGALIGLIIRYPSESVIDFGTYRKHSWTEVTAKYSASTDRYYNVFGNFSIVVDSDFPNGEYDWVYAYEINGEKYSAAIKHKTTKQPDVYAITILVADDDPELYLLSSRKKMFLGVAGQVLSVVFIIAAAFAVSMVIVKKEKAAQKGNSDTPKPYEFERDVPFPHGYDK